MLISPFIEGASAPGGGNAIEFAPAGDETLQYRIEDADAETVAHAVGSARQAFAAVRRASIADRCDLLALVAEAIDENAEELSSLICVDVGKPIRIARGEVTRGSQFVRACMAALGQMGGEVLPLDAARNGAGRFGFTRRIPFGVVGAITPFNAPINLLVQKLAPGLAAGNAVVVKPALPATRVALRLAEASHQKGVPAGMFNVVTGDREAAVHLAADERVGAVSFTGGVEGGQALLRHTGVRKFVSELGSNAANLVLADADLEQAATKIASAAFEASGQQCISAQRIIVHGAVFDAFLERFLHAVDRLRVGPARDEKVDVGPMVSLRAADRLEALYRDAIAAGAREALPWRREGRLVFPTVLTEVPREARLWTEEAFGPIALMVRAAGVDHALELANDSPFGLQGAVFTRDLATAFRCIDDFDVGALWVNEASRFRLDMYPFGGVKQSGVGREGVRYAIEELTQLKFIGINPA